MFSTLPPVNDLKLQQLGAQCGIDLVDTATAFAAFQSQGLVSLAHNVEIRCATLSDDLIHGRSLVFLGRALYMTHQPQKAMVYLDRARTMLKVVKNTASLAEACQVTSCICYAEGRLPEALDTIEEAWKLAKLIDSPFIQGTISLTFSKILLSANRDSEAWKHMEIALMKASYVGDRFTVAQTLEFMGYGYLRRADYQSAYGAYDAAAEKYIGTTGVPGVKRCMTNMARIKQKQNNPNADIGFYKPNLDFDNSLFYPPGPNTCECCAHF